MNLASIIDPHPDQAVALVSGGETVTYGALRAQVAGFRGALASLGVRAGDRVALITASNWYTVVATLSGLGLGAVVVPLNPQSPAAELRRELLEVTPRVAIVGPTAQDAFAGVDRAACGIEHVIVPEGVTLPDSRSFEDLLLEVPVPIVDRLPDDLAMLVFTSGTAGAPRAAMLSHGNLLANLEQVQAHPGNDVRRTDVALGVLPLFHIYGLNSSLLLALRAGACTVLVQRFDPASALETIRTRGVTVMAGVPPMYEAWLSMPEGDVKRSDFAGIRLAASGASRLDPDMARAFRDRFGVDIHEGYGLTEASPVVTSATDAAADHGTIGSPVPGVSVRIVDELGDDVPVGDPGEIWVKGPNVFRGYWHDDEATARALTPDGWLRTGDVAVVDEQGRLMIVDRAKDLIIVSGFNVYPAEVEEVLASHPGVAAVAVAGVPNPHSGESVKAFVVPKPDRTLEEDELIAFCGRSLARYKCPSKVQLVAELPRGLAGKVLRRELR